MTRLPFTGLEKIRFGTNLYGYGFGLLQQRGYIKLPTKKQWQGWSKQQRDDWLVKTNDELSKAVRSA